MRTISTLIIICLFIFISCQTKTPNINYHKLDDYFGTNNNDSTVNSLNQILSFFDSLVIEDTKIAAVNSAYHTYMENLLSAESTADIYEMLKADQQKVVSFIDNNFTSEGFNKIWEYSYGMIPRDYGSLIKIMITLIQFRYISHQIIMVFIIKYLIKG